MEPINNDRDHLKVVPIEDSFVTDGENDDQ